MDNQKVIDAAVEKIDTTLSQIQEESAEHDDELRGRIENLEAQQSAPGLSLVNSTKQTVIPYRKFTTREGETAFEVKGTERFGDIPELAGKSEVSLERAMAALAIGADCGDREAVEYVAELKATTTGTSGITLQNTVAVDWIDRVRAQSVFFRAGGRSVTMPTQAMTYLHQTGDPTISWRATEGASLSATDPTFASRTLTAKTAATRVQISLEASQDIADIGRQLAQAITAAMATDLDRVVFQGASGNNEPVGLINTAGRGQVAGVSLPTNWDEVVDGVVAFLNANNDLGSLSGIAMHPDVFGVYAKLKTGISSDQTPLQLPPTIEDIPRYVSTGVSVAGSPESHEIFLGNFSDGLVGFRMNPSVRILDGTTSYATNLLIEVVAAMRVDFVALRPASFVTLEGVTTS